MLGVYQIPCEIQIIHILLYYMMEGSSSNVLTSHPPKAQLQKFRLFSPFMEKSKRKQFNPNTDVSDQNSTRNIFQSEWTDS